MAAENWVRLSLSGRGTQDCGACRLVVERAICSSLGY